MNQSWIKLYRLLLENPQQRSDASRPMESQEMPAFPEILIGRLAPTRCCPAIHCERKQS